MPLSGAAYGECDIQVPLLGRTLRIEVKSRQDASASSIAGSTKPAC
jgi:hypothetical protein